MARDTMMRPVRYALVAALLGALLTLTAGVVSAAVTITATPGTAVASPVGGNTWDIPFTTISFALDVDCGDPTSPCSVWVARGNAPKVTETLFSNVTGSRANIPANFINDGCFNFRVYDSGHSIRLGQMNVGHTFVCNAVGGGQPVVVVNGSTGTQLIIGNGKGVPVPSTPLTVDFDSGYSGGIDVTELWIDRSLPGSPYGDCTTPTYPNANEVLYTRNVSGELTGLNPVGGGPYCFTLYQGSAHQTRSNEPTFLAIGPYLTYSGGTPVAGKDNAQGTVYFNSGNSGLNALICVNDNGSPVPLVYNSQGYGNKVATFQIPGAGSYAYVLWLGVTNFDAFGNPMASSCGTGTRSIGFIVAT